MAGAPFLVGGQTNWSSGRQRMHHIDIQRFPQGQFLAAVDGD